MSHLSDCAIVQSLLLTSTFMFAHRVERWEKHAVNNQPNLQSFKALFVLGRPVNHGTRYCSTSTVNWQISTGRLQGLLTHVSPLALESTRQGQYRPMPPRSMPCRDARAFSSMRPCGWSGRLQHSLYLGLVSAENLRACLICLDRGGVEPS